MPDDDTEMTLIRKVNAQLEFYCKIDPHTLTDEEWAIKWHNLIWTRTIEAKTNPF
jgi:hypothetical protein